MSANPDDAPGGRRTDPSLQPTSASALVLAALVGAALGWLLLGYNQFFYRVAPLPWTAAVVLVALTLTEAYLAQNTSARIQRKPGAPPVEPLLVARYVALAKASSLVGALTAGFSAGVLAWLVLEPTDAARSDVPTVATTLVAAGALVGAALWLERSCRVPHRPDRQDDDSDRPAGGR
ncbi:DUF3180 domain-containing protein [Actinoplanes teichomyceticus]|uniref:Uncharacterized protein DUF3180 n=1 Tax=Actinoplanes teichomyceticus TaxID=1867 RepID=A0A561WQK1_ACTTI|nr:DUF3180 domain-containing protein [Actinoplanes teichomyceticus]TWG26134.1 uncharacterized protein DUF3180 [Actinoplanes teichomyceticus]GIF11209.1 hypothetical protein Ate01nite_12410 [Actinoplanes teichomyceticus]